MIFTKINFLSLSSFAKISLIDQTNSGSVINDKNASSGFMMNIKTTMKRMMMIALMAVVTLMAGAENYPYRSDYLWVTVPDHADWLYKTGEKANIEIQFYKYGIPRNGEVTYTVTLQDSASGVVSRVVSYQNVEIYKNDVLN